MTTTTLPRITVPLTVGRLVSVSAPGTWLHGRAGVVLTVGRFADELVDVRIDGTTPLGFEPTRTMDPRRLAPVSSLVACPTCRTGCDCEGGVEGIGCAHHGCWGRASTQDCPGRAYEYARRAALSGPREEMQIHAARRRGHDVMVRVIAGILAAHGLADPVGVAPEAV